MPLPNTTPGRQAAIGRVERELRVALGVRLDGLTDAVVHNAARQLYDAALAEQPREEWEIPTLGCRRDTQTFLIGDRDGFCARCGLPAESHFHLPAEQPRGEEERQLKIALMERDWLLGAWAAACNIPQAEAEAEMLKWSEKWREGALNTEEER